MPVRRLPRTDEERASALNMAKKRKDEVPATEVPMSAATVARLDLAQPDLKQRMQARANALSAQAEATAAIEPERSRTRMYISHFFQAFNNGVARGMFPPAHRAYYKLDVSSEAVPPLDSVESITTWGSNLLEGDAERLLNGGAPMAMPTAAEVQAVYDNFLTATGIQADRKQAYDTAQEKVAAMRSDADSLILRMWNEIEAAYSEEDAPSKRRKARQWGVVYISSPGEGLEKEGDIGPLVHLNIFADMAEDSSITVRNIGATDLHFYRAEAADAPPHAEGRKIRPSEELTLPLSEFGTSGNYLNVFNPSPDDEGGWLAKLEGK
ncbi:MAG: hypothetical protein H6603_11085 [Flavobacteriales bacterium]|nr:hypothetical protein [Flavobacteriales bacterium]